MSGAVHIQPGKVWLRRLGGSLGSAVLVAAIGLSLAAARSSAIADPAPAIVEASHVSGAIVTGIDQSVSPVAEGLAKLAPTPGALVLLGLGTLAFLRRN
ncbi:MAG: hypothetical protein AAGB51_06680 [Planctomycetota bacterium]